MQVGIIGLKFTGKTTLYNAVTGAGIPTGQGGVDPHRAIGQVPDPRLDFLHQQYLPRRKVNAQVEWVDIPGFQAGPSTDGDREAIRFLEHGRKVDALAQVVRCFDAGFGPPDPVHEIETLALELALADLQIVENRLDKLIKDKQKIGKLDNPQEPDLLERFRTQLERDRPLRELELHADEVKIAAGFRFLTQKPLIYVLNHGEGAEPQSQAETTANRAGGEVVTICAKMEEELAELSPDEAAEFLNDLGISEPALSRMIRAAYTTLNLQSFFTIGKDEVRAWNVPKGTKAPEAAGVIHTDMERGFIRAVVVAYEDFFSCGDMAAAKQANKVREEGKNYVVQDGDIIEIRFNV